MFTKVSGGVDGMMCNHKVTGKGRFNCKKGGLVENSCWKQCSELDYCMGFGIGSFKGQDKCWLFVSEARCPANWESFGTAGTVALNGDDLIAGEDPGSCYAKVVPGNL